MKLAPASLVLAFLPIALLSASPASSESLERSSFDFAAIETFEKKEKQRKKDGYVLENVRDKRGKTAGKLSLGGNGRAEDPFYDFGATQNIRASRENELGSGLLNLRISF